MYLLKNTRNASDAAGQASEGDIIVSQDFRSSYLVFKDGNRRLRKADHVDAVHRVRAELLALPIRRAAQQKQAKAVEERLLRDAAEENARIAAVHAENTRIAREMAIRRSELAWPWYRRWAVFAGRSIRRVFGQ